MWRKYGNFALVRASLRDSTRTALCQGVQHRLLFVYDKAYSACVVSCSDIWGCGFVDIEWLRYIALLRARLAILQVSVIFVWTTKLFYCLQLINCLNLFSYILILVRNLQKNTRSTSHVDKMICCDVWGTCKGVWMGLKRRVFNIHLFKPISYVLFITFMQGYS